MFVRTCNVYPESAACSACLATRQMFDVVDDCNKCELKNRIYELVNTGSDFWGGYAIVLYEGKIEKVSLKRVHNIENNREGC